jgi:hypothetical protein
MVRVGDEKTGKSGYIDRTGKYFVNPDFDEAYAFANDGVRSRLFSDTRMTWRFSATKSSIDGRLSRKAVPRRRLALLSDHVRNRTVLKLGLWHVSPIHAIAIQIDRMLRKS